MPTATTPVSPVARGILEEVVQPTATKPGYIVFHVPTSSYRLHLRPVAGLDSIKTAIGKRIIGVITCEARRADIVDTGGRLVEPVEGRPRRVHGTVIAVDTGANTLTLNCGGGAAVDSASLPFVVKLVDPRNKAELYPLGVTVATDVLEGATFDPR